MLEAKYATSANTLLAFNVYRYSYDVTAVSASPVVDFRGEAPKRRKRVSQLLRVTEFSR